MNMHNCIYCKADGVVVGLYAQYQLSILGKPQHHLNLNVLNLPHILQILTIILYIGLCNLLPSM